MRLAKLADRINLDEMSSAGRVASKGNPTRAGRVYQKHMSRNELPKVPGKSLDEAGQNLLDDILTHPGSEFFLLGTGRARGGVCVVRPDGTGAAFFPDGSLAFFGNFR